MSEETVEDFERFWTIWPRKVAKRDARKAFDKAVDDGEDPIDIIAGVHAMIRKGLPESAKFIPFPATWIRAGRWDDEEYEAPIKRAEAPTRKLQGQAWADTVMRSDAGQRAIKEGLANDMYCWALRNPGEYPDEHLFETFAADKDYCRKAVAHELEPGRNIYGPLLASFYRNFKTNEERLAKRYSRD